VLLFADLVDHLGRLQSIILRCSDARTIQSFARVLNRSSSKFRFLRSLQLSIISPVVVFTSARSLLKNNCPDSEPHISAMSDIPSWSHLRHLRLHEVPLFNLPTHFLANLATLVLSFRQTRGPAHVNMLRYRLRMSSLCSFLEFTRNLEELYPCQYHPLLQCCSSR
jgi:hypothetical protein